MKVPGFAGPSVPARSRTVNSERTVNLYLEQTTGTPQASPALYVRPAAVPWTYVAPGPVRAMFHQDDRFNAVSGSFYYTIERSKNVTVIGQVRNDSRPAFIATNGSGGFQNMIVSGGLGYIHNFSTGVFTQITDPNFPNPCTFCAYVDGYFVALQGNSNRFQISDLMDGLTWSGLDVAQASLTSDNKVSMVVSNRRPVFLGTRFTEIWYDSGNAGFPFQPDTSAGVIEHGIAAPYSAQRLDNTVYWVGRDETGNGVVWRLNGYTPERISDHAVEFVLQGLPHLERCVGFAFQVSGHAWYALYIPGAETTWLYDIGANAWAEWALWDEVALRFRPFIGWQQCTGWGMNFIGARNNGTIYTLETDTYADSIVTVGGVS